MGPKRVEDVLDIRAIRDELDLSQSDFAALVDVSVRTVQACEQGWRKPSSSLQKSALLLLITCRNGPDFAKHMCWDQTDCSEELRDQCVVHLGRQGHLCWFLTGSMCRGYRLQRWVDKLSMCRECEFFRQLLHGELPLLSR